MKASPAASCTLALVAALSLFGAPPALDLEEDRTPPQAAASATNAVAAARDDGAAALAAADTDEIDLEEIDDSADAARRPQIKASDEGDVDLVDISCDEATLADILRQFRKTTNANIIHDDSTNLLKRVSVELRHVPWEDALQSILKSRGFRLESRGNIYFVSEDRQAVPILTKSFALNHASSDELATLFNESYAPKGKDGKIIQKIANPFPGANVVVVTSDEKTIADCEAIIRTIDKAVSQIYIEARFIELSNEAMHKMGFDWSQLKSWGASTRDVSASLGFVTDKSVVLNRDGSIAITDAAASGLKTSRDTSDASWSGHTGTTLGSSGEAKAQSASSASSSRDLSSSSSWKGSRTSNRNATSSKSFAGTLSVDDFRLAISAFESMGDAKIFSNPKVIVSNGKEARVDMTTKYPYIELTSQRNTQSDNSYLDYSAKLQQIPGDLKKGLFAGSAFFSYGIELTVRPRISPDGLIAVDITPSISYVDEYYNVANGSAAGGGDNSYGKFPIIKMKSISTEFTMKDGSTAVIGGLSKTEEEDVDDGIPYLRKLPWIGPHLFGSKSRQKVQYEIIVCVTVGIANPADLPRDVGLPKNAVLGREYVEGRRFEPGDRVGGADKALSLDMDSLDGQREKRDAAFRKRNDDEIVRTYGAGTGALARASPASARPRPAPDMKRANRGRVVIRRAR